MSNMSGLIGGATTSGEQVSGERLYYSYGQLRTEYEFYSKALDGGARTSISREQYVEGPKSRKEAKARNLNYTVEIKAIVHLDHAKAIAIEAGQPEDKAYEYERGIIVGGPDWNKNVIPALEELRGKPFSKNEQKRAQEIDETWQSLQGQWLESADVPQWKTVKDGDTYKTVKAEKEEGSGRYWTSFYPLRTFKNREECVAARKQRYSRPASNGTATVTASAAKVYAMPDSETAETWPRAMAVIRKRLARGDSAENIAADLEIEVTYVTQFNDEVPA